MQKVSGKEKENMDDLKLETEAATQQQPDAAQLGADSSDPAPNLFGADESKSDGSGDDGSGKADGSGHDDVAVVGEQLICILPSCNKPVETGICTKHSIPKLACRVEHYRLAKQQGIDVVRAREHYSALHNRRIDGERARELQGNVVEADAYADLEAQGSGVARVQQDRMVELLALPFVVEQKSEADAYAKLVAQDRRVEHDCMVEHVAHQDRSCVWGDDHKSEPNPLAVHDAVEQQAVSASGQSTTSTSFHFHSPPPSPWTITPAEDAFRRPTTQTSLAPLAPNPCVWRRPATQMSLALPAPYPFVWRRTNSTPTIPRKSRRRRVSW